MSAPTTKPVATAEMERLVVDTLLSPAADTQPRKRNGSAAEALSVLSGNGGSQRAATKWKAVSVAASSGRPAGGRVVSKGPSIQLGASPRSSPGGAALAVVTSLALPRRAASSREPEPEPELQPELQPEIEAEAEAEPEPEPELEPGSDAVLTGRNGRNGSNGSNGSGDHKLRAMKKSPKPRRTKRSRDRRLSTFDLGNIPANGRRGSVAMGASMDLSMDSVVEVQARNVVEGKLEFAQGREVLDSAVVPPRGTLREARQARFIKCQVSEWTQPFLELERAKRKEQVELLRGLCDFMRTQWNLAPPSVIISVTGDAGPLNLRPHKREIFRTALLNATRSTNAWIVTGGTSSGVMKLVGDALKAYKKASPCLAVCGWGIVHGRTRSTETETGLEMTADEEQHAAMPAFAANLRAAMVDVRRTVPMFKVLPPETLAAVEMAFEPVAFVPHEVIVTEGELAHEGLFVIESGNCEIIINGKVVATVGPNKFFGEKALVETDGLRSATVRAMDMPVTCFRLGKEAWDEHVAEYEGQMRESNMLNEERYQVQEQVEGKAKAENKEVAQTMEEMLAIPRDKKGSAENPFIYDGKRKDGEKPGAGLDQNHSHYILLDDDSNGKWGTEIEFRHDLEEFVSYGLDRSDQNIEMLEKTMHESAKRSDIGRQIPVILLCYGGGPGTFNTVLAAVRSCRPILFFVGSGRITDLICAWRNIHLRGKRHKTSREEVFEEQMAHCTDITNVADFPGVPFRTEDIMKWRDKLDEIVLYDEIHLFDFHSTDAADKLVMASKKHTSNPLLPILLGAIFDSKGVLESGKVPLAIRYNNHEQVTKRLQHKGLIITDHDDPTNDSRHLIYAAFYDQAKIVSEMIATGYSIEALDQLICLELKQEMVYQSLHAPFAQWDRLPPKSWRMMQKNHQQMKLKSTSDSSILMEWKKLSLIEQEMIINREVKRVGWEKLPFLPGWTYSVVAQKPGANTVVPVGTTFRSSASKAFSTTAARAYTSSPKSSPRSPKASLAHDHATASAGDGGGADSASDGGGADEVDASGTNHLNVDAACGVKGVRAEEVKLYSLDKELKIDVWGEVLTTQQAMEYVDLSDRAASPQGSRSPPGSPAAADRIERIEEVKEDIFVKIQTEDTGWVVLRREPKDDVVGCLEFKALPAGVAFWKGYSRSEIGAILYSRAQKAFEQWLPKSGGEGKLDLSRTPLHPYLRIYWAIATGRDKLARALWKESKEPFISSFLGKYVYANLGGIISTQRSTQMTGFKQKMKDKWDSLATEMLSHLDPKGGNLLSGNMVFSEYVYFGTAEEEQPDYQLLPERMKIENSCRRAALELMSVNPEIPLTRIDLAISAENKSFMGHPSTEEFLKAMSVKPCGHDLDWSNAKAQVSPKTKLYVHVLGQMAFIALFTYVYTSFPVPLLMRSQLEKTGSVFATFSPWEWLLWTWVATLIFEEFQQLFEDYGGRPLHYLNASGNRVDAISSLIFLLAFLLRLSGGPMTYMVMSFLMMFNLLVWMCRLLDSLSFFERVGVIIIAMERIWSTNIIPFVAFATLFVVCFEVAAFTFTWILERDYKPGEFFNMFSQVMHDQIEYNQDLGLLWWDRPSAGVETFAVAFKTLFFIMTVVILMNVLIAMMTNTYQQVFKVSTQEWRLLYAKKVKEYYQSPVLPSPLTVLESFTNKIMADKLPSQQNTGAARRKRRSLEEEHNWGRHDIFPVSSLPYELHMATSRYVRSTPSSHRRTTT
jgi:CRP-like cAMP-binding protein